jgi:inward rectifier potassium channel
MPKNRNLPKIKIIGKSGGALDYFYHQALEIPIGLFILYSMLTFFGVNFIFALFYYFTSGLVNTVSSSGGLQFPDAVYFSLTFPVIGFGGIFPAGIGRVIAPFQIFMGLLFLGSLTGLIFARFSRSKSPLVWSCPVVLFEENRKHYIQVRVTNVLGNDVVNVTASLFLQRSEKNRRGETIRRLHPIPLEMTSIPIAAFSWILSHPVTDNSPLLDWSQGKINQNELLVGFIYGYDSTLGKEV